MNKNNEESKPMEHCGKNIGKRHHHYECAKNDAIYGMGVIGALFYFLKGATTFAAVMIGIGKSIFWPAILMFKLLTYLKM